MCDTTVFPPSTARRTSVAIASDVDKGISELIPILHRETNERPNVSDVINVAVRELMNKHNVVV